MDNSFDFIFTFLAEVGVVLDTEQLVTHFATEFSRVGYVPARVSPHCATADPALSISAQARAFH